MYESYNYLLSKRMYQAKTGSRDQQALILAECFALAQSNHLKQYKATLKIVVFEIYHTLDIDDMPDSIQYWRRKRSAASQTAGRKQRVVFCIWRPYRSESKPD